MSTSKPSEEIVRLLYKPKKAAAKLDTSVRTIYGLAGRGELELVHEGRGSFITAISIDAYIARLRDKAAARWRERNASVGKASANNAGS